MTWVSQVRELSMAARVACRPTVPLRSARTRAATSRRDVMRSVSITLFVLLSTAVAVVGQQPPESGERSGRGPIASVGIGGGPLGLAGVLSAGRRTSSGDIFVRAAGATNVEVAFSPGQTTGRTDSSLDVAALWGRRRVLGARGWVRVAAGPALALTKGAWGFGECLTSENCGEEGQATTAGLAVQVDGAWVTGQHEVGIGVFGDGNGDRSFWGITIGVYFGGR